VEIAARKKSRSYYGNIILKSNVSHNNTKPRSSHLASNIDKNIQEPPDLGCAGIDMATWLWLYKSYEANSSGQIQGSVFKTLGYRFANQKSDCYHETRPSRGGARPVHSSPEGEAGFGWQYSQGDR